MCVRACTLRFNLSLLALGPASQGYIFLGPTWTNAHGLRMLYIKDIFALFLWMYFWKPLGPTLGVNQMWTKRSDPKCIQKWICWFLKYMSKKGSLGILFLHLLPSPLLPPIRPNLVEKSHHYFPYSGFSSNNNYIVNTPLFYTIHCSETKLLSSKLPLLYDYDTR